MCIPLSYWDKIRINRGFSRLSEGQCISVLNVFWTFKVQNAVTGLRRLEVKPCSRKGEGGRGKQAPLFGQAHITLLLIKQLRAYGKFDCGSPIWGHLWRRCVTRSSVKGRVDPTAVKPVSSEHNRWGQMFFEDFRCLNNVVFVKYGWGIL